MYGLKRKGRGTPLSENVATGRRAWGSQRRSGRKRGRAARNLEPVTQGTIT